MLNHHSRQLCQIRIGSIAMAMLLASFFTLAKLDVASAELREKIFFLAQGPWPAKLALASMNPDGSGRKELAQFPFDRTGLTNDEKPDVVLSQDGTKVVFRLYVTNPQNETKTGIALIDLSRPQDLVWLARPSGPHEAYSAPKFSPDAQKVVFEGESAVQQGRIVSPRHSIYSINTDGSGFQQLTFPATESVSDYNPTFSSDGQRIFFHHNEDLYQMNADGTNQQNALPGVTLPTSGGILSPIVVSPDSTKIVYSGWPRAARSEDDLYLINLQTLQVTDLTNTPAVQDSHPKFSPDGSKILFRSRLTNDIYESGFGYGDIKVVNLDGSGQRNITNDVDYENEPVFSPDGTRISFTSAPSMYEPFSIHTIRFDGSNEQESIPHLEDNRNYLPMWRLVQSNDSPPPPPPPPPPPAVSAFKDVKGNMTLRHGRVVLTVKGRVEPKNALGNVQLSLAGKKVKKLLLQKQVRLHNGLFRVRTTLSKRTSRTLRRLQKAKLTLSYSGVTRNGRVEIAPATLTQSLQLRRK